MSADKKMGQFSHRRVLALPHLV